MSKTKSKEILKYEVVFEEVKEGGYTVFVHALPGCISEGDSFEEAKKNITEAISAYVESLAKDKIKVVSQDKNFFIGEVEIPISKLSFT